MTLEAGTVIANKYRIERMLGEGGMGSVYLAVHTELDREFAVKTLLARANTEDGVDRFRREARAAGRIGNDHILEVFDIGQTRSGDHYMVMELLRGETLSKRLERVGRLSEQSLIHIGLQLLNGLGAAHRAGIVHRDLKPDNIFLLANKAGIADFVKIIDFGISRFRTVDGSSEGNLTKTGVVLGTPFYLSPEQASGKRDLDARSDLHTVGTIFYQCLAGRIPLHGIEDLQDLLVRILIHEPPDILQFVPDLDPQLAAIVSKAMAKRRELRYQTTDEFGEALRAWTASKGGVLQATSQAIAVAQPPIPQGIPINDASQPVVASQAAPGSASTPPGSTNTQPPSNANTNANTPPGDATTSDANTQGAWHQSGLTTPTQQNNKMGWLALAAGLLLAAGLVVGGGLVAVTVAHLWASNSTKVAASGRPATNEDGASDDNEDGAGRTAFGRLNEAKADAGDNPSRTSTPPAASSSAAPSSSSAPPPQRVQTTPVPPHRRPESPSRRTTPNKPAARTESKEWDFRY